MERVFLIKNMNSRHYLTPQTAGKMPTQDRQKARRFLSFSVASGIAKKMNGKHGRGPWKLIPFGLSGDRVVDLPKPTSKCLSPTCTKNSKVRGLCSSCYGDARRMVMSGKTSWYDLIQANLILPSTHRVKESSPFEEAFAKLQE